MTTIYTGGTFDLFHHGHVNLLSRCRALGDRVVVGLNPDDFVTRYKGRPPVWDYARREQALRECPYVDEVLANVDGEDAKPILLNVRPDFLVVGSDWACKDYYAQMNFTQEWLDQHGIILLYVPYTVGISSTMLRQQLQGEIPCT